MTNINISFWSTSSPAAADALESLYCASLQPLQPNIEIFRVGDTSREYDTCSYTYTDSARNIRGACVLITVISVACAE